MLRRVQPHLGRGAVRGRCPGEVHTGRDPLQEGDLQLPRRGDQARPHRRHLHHDEPGLRGSHGAAGEPEGSLPVRSSAGQWHVSLLTSSQHCLYHAPVAV